MYKIIVVSNCNKIYEQKIINENKKYIVETIEKFSKKDKEIILEEKELVIVLDLDIDISYEILDFIINIKLPKYKNSIILEGDLDKFIVNNYSMSYIYGYIKQKNSFHQLINIIAELVKEKSTDYIVEKIINELNYLGYDFTHKGTKYLIESIKYLYFNAYKMDCILEKEIYPLIGKKYKKTVHNIKCNITNATMKMYRKNDKNKLLKYLNVQNESEIKLKKIILKVLRKI